jgi:hypothetical protein
MVSVTYNTRERRLVLDGACGPDDDRRVALAIREHAEPGRSLVLDLTRLGHVPAEVDAAITDVRRSVARDGSWISVWALPGSVGAEAPDATRTAPSLAPSV